MLFKKRSKPAAINAAPVAETEPGEPSYLGRDAVIEGNVSCDGELHVDGALRGTVRARVCVVDTRGVVQGELSGEVIHVRGRVIGPIQGSKVYIHAGAHVEGDVFHDTISIENGAYVYGTIRHNASPPPPTTAYPPLGGSMGSSLGSPLGSSLGSSGLGSSSLGTSSSLGSTLSPLNDSTSSTNGDSDKDPGGIRVVHSRN